MRFFAKVRLKKVKAIKENSFIAFEGALLKFSPLLS
jgi:hypothetical protein